MTPSPCPPGEVCSLCCVLLALLCTTHQSHDSRVSVCLTLREKKKEKKERKICLALHSWGLPDGAAEPGSCACVPDLRQSEQQMLTVSLSTAKYQRQPTCPSSYPSLVILR